jgi:CHASE2 domain-containing sensor protein
MSTEPTNAAERGALQPRGGAGEVIVGFAVLGLFIAGTIGLLRAWRAIDPLDGAVCLAASIVAFGAICYLSFRKL